MDIKINDYCVVIASHISKEKRIEYLIECLKSLINQDVVIPIYLSIFLPIFLISLISVIGLVRLNEK